jgi:hypothetical protein
LIPTVTLDFVTKIGPFDAILLMKRPTSLPIYLYFVYVIFLCKQCLGSALFNYCKYTRACTKGVYLEQACTKCTYNRHIAIKQEKDIHEVGDEVVEKHM